MLENTWHKTNQEQTLKTKYNPEKANNTKYSKTKLAWFSRFLIHSARKQGGLTSTMLLNPHGTGFARPADPTQ